MTGHKGLIGSSLLERLQERGDEAVALIDKRNDVNILDICGVNVSEQADVMIHLAAFCKISEVNADPMQTQCFLYIIMFLGHKKY